MVLQLCARADVTGCDGRLINTKERRISTLQVLQAHPFFAGVEWKTLRDRPAPFIPALDSEVDSGYFDDVSSEGMGACRLKRMSSS